MPGTLVLDCEGLSRAVGQRLTEWLAGAVEENVRVVVSAATIVEVLHPKINRARFEWTLSRLVVEPVTKEVAVAATGLLKEAGLHGHRHAIDAIVCATAQRHERPVTILTSDPEDISVLVGDWARVVKL
ncbi:hypothetical protein SAMN05421505_110173 [Sinosporangium album]|uniref:PIN domain-containing protein n=1 Tax=Sinosporangium album TaxID=504805 RepID=A0A1G7Z3F8_9ACTN|nr:PIN domain-containing protein [Sinosporangium album]SDH03167.1 hypothetical protein SAMN05421505_110173 [Sinosporangium album]